MRKVAFAINSTIDGYADHTAVVADDELHDFYTGLLKKAGTILFGRKTYQLMESFWLNAKDDPRSTKSMIRYADAVNPINKILFSRSLKTVTWQNSDICNTDVID